MFQRPGLSTTSDLLRHRYISLFARLDPEVPANTALQCYLFGLWEMFSHSCDCLRCKISTLQMFWLTYLLTYLLAPQYLVDSVQSVAESSRRPGLRSANTADYVKRCTRMKFGERCFSHAGPAAWNSLPASIKLTTDTNRFQKKLLKSHLFHIAFWHFVTSPWTVCNPHSTNSNDQLLSFSAWHCWLGHLTRKNRPQYEL